MRIWIDLTAPEHPVVFRPLPARLRAPFFDRHVAEPAPARDLLAPVAIARAGVQRGGAAR